MWLTRCSCICAGIFKQSFHLTSTKKPGRLSHAIKTRYAFAYLLTNLYRRTYWAQLVLPLARVSTLHYGIYHVVSLLARPSSCHSANVKFFSRSFGEHASLHHKLDKNIQLAAEYNTLWSQTHLWKTALCKRRHFSSFMWMWHFGAVLTLLISLNWTCTPNSDDLKAIWALCILVILPPSCIGEMVDLNTNVLRKIHNQSEIPISVLTNSLFVHYLI